MTNLNISDLTDLIFYLIKKIKKYKNSLSNAESNSYKEIVNILSQNIEEEKKLIRDNNNFKTFYYLESLIKVTEIDCPDIMGYDELIGEDGKYTFSIQAKTIENIIYTIDYKFYTDLYNKNSSVKKHHDDLMAIKLDLILKRLFKIRNSTISSFFNHKIEADISAIISKELEDEKTSCTKLKRFLQFKSTNYNFYKKNDDLSFVKDMINDKDFLKDKSNYLKDKMNKSREKMNLFSIYTNNIFKKYSRNIKMLKKLILPKTDSSKKKNICLVLRKIKKIIKKKKDQIKLHIKKY